eukprot:tig00000655_g2869.t1
MASTSFVAAVPLPTGRPAEPRRATLLRPAVARKLRRAAPAHPRPHRAGGAPRLPAIEAADNNSITGTPTITWSDPPADPMDPFGKRGPRIEEGVAPGSVAVLGKFDALHRGHRSLASRAADVGNPVLLSFNQMAAVLGWEGRLPFVAPADRHRVLSGWAALVNRPVGYLTLPFGQIREMQPRDFVGLLRDMGFEGAVAGHNFRFGYHRTGDIQALHAHGATFGLRTACLAIVPDDREGTPVSSTRCRRALAAGDLPLTTELLGRPHRVLGEAEALPAPATPAGDGASDAEGPGFEPELVVRRPVNFCPPPGRYCGYLRAPGLAAALPSLLEVREGERSLELYIAPLSEGPRAGQLQGPVGLDLIDAVASPYEAMSVLRQGSRPPCA